VQLSHNTSAMQCEGMAVKEQLKKFINACECFSLPFDKLIDLVNVAQFCVFIRIVFET